MSIRTQAQRIVFTELTIEQQTECAMAMHIWLDGQALLATLTTVQNCMLDLNVEVLFLEARDTFPIQTQTKVKRCLSLL